MSETKPTREHEERARTDRLAFIERALNGYSAEYLLDVVRDDMAWLLGECKRARTALAEAEAPLRAEIERLTADIAALRQTFGDVAEQGYESGWRAGRAEGMRDGERAGLERAAALADEQDRVTLAADIRALIPAREGI